MQNLIKICALVVQIFWCTDGRRTDGRLMIPEPQLVELAELKMYMSIKYYNTVLPFWVGNGAAAVPTEYKISYIYINNNIILNSHYQPNTLPVNKTIVHYISKKKNIIYIYILLCNRELVLWTVHKLSRSQETYGNDANADKDADGTWNHNIPWKLFRWI
jgi:hypothetical protein